MNLFHKKVRYGPKTFNDFYSSIFLLLLLNFLVKPLWIFAIDRQVQNIVGLEVYGKYFALLNITFVLNFLLDPGITTYYNLQTATQNPLKQQFLPSVLLKFCFGISYSLILITFGWVTGIQNTQILLLLGLVQFLFSLFLFLRSHITAKQQFATDAWLSVLDKCIMIIFCGLLIYMPHIFGIMDIHKFIVLQIFSISISISFAFAIIWKQGINLRSCRIKIPISILRNAWPYGLIVLVMSAINRQDSFLLERLNHDGDYQAGIYAGAYRLLDTANMVGYLVAAFLLPYIAKNWFRDTSMHKVILLCRNLLLVLSICVILFITIYVIPLQRLLYHSNNAYQASIIRFCIPALIGYSLVQVYGTVLTATGHIRLFLKLSIPFFIINLLLNILFIPTYGAIACCIIGTLTQLIYGIVLMVMAERIYARKVNPAIINFRQNLSVHE